MFFSFVLISCFVFTSFFLRNSSTQLFYVFFVLFSLMLWWELTHQFTFSHLIKLFHFKHSLTINPVLDLVVSIVIVLLIKYMVVLLGLLKCTRLGYLIQNQNKWTSFTSKSNIWKNSYTISGPNHFVIKNHNVSRNHTSLCHQLFSNNLFFYTIFLFWRILIY